jgi:ribonuclease-3
MVTRPRALAALQRRLGITFERAALLQEALTHSSFANESEDLLVQHNQRLEFLGDAILDLVVGRWLFDRFPEATEGELTSLRARLVRTEALAALAKDLNLGDYMRFGHGEEASGGRNRIANLCAAYEALVGAIYLDQSLETIEAWLVPQLESYADEIEFTGATKDAKSELQELIQASRHVAPQYELIATAGPDHARVFTVRVVVDGADLGTGTGASKQMAQQAAAAEALKGLRGDADG